MCNVKPETYLSKTEFIKQQHLTVQLGANDIYRFGNFFYKVKPPDLSMETAEMADG